MGTPDTTPADDPSGSEARLDPRLEAAAGRLAAEFPAVCPDRVRALLLAAHRGTEPVSVQLFRSVLTEREVRRALRRETAPGQGRVTTDPRTGERPPT